MKLQKTIGDNIVFIANVNMLLNFGDLWGGTGCSIPIVTQMDLLCGKY